MLRKTVVLLLVVHTHVATLFLRNHGRHALEEVASI
jgi:hypothetical protein